MDTSDARPTGSRDKIYWVRRGAGDLHCGGSDLRLTATGATIVDRPLANSGRAVTCDRLIDAVYGGARLPENSKGVVQVTICKLCRMGIPIRSRGRGSLECYWLDHQENGFKPSDRYRIEGCPGVFTVKQVIEAPAFVFENDAPSMEAMKSADDPVLKTLRRIL